MANKTNKTNQTLRMHDTSLNSEQLDNIRKRLMVEQRASPETRLDKVIKATKNQTADDSKYWTIAGLAELWGVGVKTIRREIHSGNLPCTKIGGAYRIPDSWRINYEIEQSNMATNPREY